MGSCQIGVAEEFLIAAKRLAGEGGGKEEGKEEGEREGEEEREREGEEGLSLGLLFYPIIVC